MFYYNPIIPGFNPDPSICRVENDYYLVTSTCEFFPGVMLYHSKDLVNWETLGGILNSSQLVNLNKCACSAGIFAPTLRYHDGWFYLITTNVSDKGNFIIRSQDLKKWTDPVWIDPKGIDPSLFFDGDGKVYFVRNDVDDNMKQGIVLCEINVITGEKLSETKVISYGCGWKCPEGPHIYKHNGWYYLLLAEGGTEYGHMATIQRSKNIFGPYEKYQDNPILKNKDVMFDDVSCTGHADLFTDTEGNTWLVCLGVRKNGNRFMHHLGRETFLAPVEWHDDWPVVNGDGIIHIEMNAKGTGTQNRNYDFYDDFSKNNYSSEWTWIRNPYMDHYIRDTANKQLILTGTNVILNDQDSPTWIGVRQKEFDITASAIVQINNESTNSLSRAGMSVFYNKDYHYDICISQHDGKSHISLYKHVHDIYTETASVPFDNDSCKFVIRADKDKYEFYYETDQQLFYVGKGLTAGVSTENTWQNSFTGTFISLFAENCTCGFREFRLVNN